MQLADHRLRKREALEVFKSMQAAEEEPDVISYNSLIAACAKGGKTEEALEVFKSMQEFGEQPNVISILMNFRPCEDTLRSPSSAGWGHGLPVRPVLGRHP